MKKFQKMTALLVAMIMLIGLISGCGSNEAQETSPKEEVKPAQSAEATEEKTSETEEKEFSYPMEGKTLTHAVGIVGQQEAAGYDSFGETEYAKAVEAATGVHVEYIQGRDDWFSLMLAEEEYPDVMESWWESSYPGGLEGAGRDGVIIPLNDVIDQYMPNYKAWLENNKKDAEVLYTPEGIVYGVPFVYENEEMLNTTGLMIRKDIMDELGLEMPATLDDWHQVLTTIKEEKNMIPYSNPGGNLLTSGGFFSAFCPSGTYSLDPESGKVVYTQSTDAYKEYLKLMNQWYDEKLIDPDIATLNWATVFAKKNSGEAAAIYGWNTDLETTEVDMIAVPNPAKEEGALVHKSPATRVAKYWAAISSQCEDVEAAARYLDWFYSEEGIMVSNFGIEGVTYTMENGSPVFTEEITNNPDGLTQTAAEGKYVRSYSAFPGVRDHRFEPLKFKVQATKDSYGIWGSVGTTEYRLPDAVKLTTEEAESVAAIEAEVKTYVKEMCMKFLIGTEDIDAKWDEYLETLEKYKLNEAVAVYQAAYDSYLAR